MLLHSSCRMVARCNSSSAALVGGGGVHRRGCHLPSSRRRSSCWTWSVNQTVWIWKLDIFSQFFAIFFYGGGGRHLKTPLVTLTLRFFKKIHWRHEPLPSRIPQVIKFNCNCSWSNEFLNDISTTLSIDCFSSLSAVLSIEHLLSGFKIRWKH